MNQKEQRVPERAPAPSEHERRNLELVARLRQQNQRSNDEAVLYSQENARAPEAK